MKKHVDKLEAEKQPKLTLKRGLSNQERDNCGNCILEIMKQVTAFKEDVRNQGLISMIDSSLTLIKEGVPSDLATSEKEKLEGQLALCKCIFSTPQGSGYKCWPTGEILSQSYYEQVNPAGRLGAEKFNLMQKGVCNIMLRNLFQDFQQKQETKDAPSDLEIINTLGKVAAFTNAYQYEEYKTHLAPVEHLLTEVVKKEVPNKDKGCSIF